MPGKMAPQHDQQAIYNATHFNVSDSQTEKAVSVKVFEKLNPKQRTKVEDLQVCGVALHFFFLGGVVLTLL